MSSKNTINLTGELYDDLETYIDKTDFESVDEYVNFVIENLLYHLRENPVHSEKADPDEEIEDRLKSLGYLD